MSFVVVCQCGKRLLAKEGHIGRQIKCPGCGGVLEIPDPAQTAPSGQEAPVDSLARAASAADAPRPPFARSFGTSLPSSRGKAGYQAGRRTGITVAIVCGTAMLMTLFVPWFFYQTPEIGGYGRGTQVKTLHVKMSWDVIDMSLEAGRYRRAPAFLRILPAWLILTWILGVGVAVSVPLVPTVRVRAIILLAAGLIATIFTLVAVGSAVSAPQITQSGGPIVLTVVGWLAITIMLVGVLMRTRFPDSMTARLIPGVAGGIVAALTLLSFILGLCQLPDFQRLPNRLVGWFVTGTVLVSVAQLMIIAAGILSLVNAFTARADPRSLARMSLGLACGGIGIVLLILLVLVPIGTEQGGIFFATLNALIIVFSGLVLLGGGGLALAQTLLWKRQQSDPIRQEAQAAAASGQPMDLTAKLQQFKILYEQGLITKEEYDEKRQQALNEA